MFERNFYLLAQECHLTRAVLLEGLTAFSYVNVDRVGTLYSAFFPTSIGLERLMKIVVVLDHKVQHNLAAPTNAQLRVVGHDLVALYKSCAAIAAKQYLPSAEWFTGDTVEHEMLAFLSRFAKQSRYYNLDAVSGAQQAIDPLAEWVRLHQRIALTYIGYASRLTLMEQAIAVAGLEGTCGWERWIDGQYVSTLEANYLHSLLKKANCHCVWTVLRLLKPFHALLDVLCAKTHEIEVKTGIDNPTVPYATEFFPFFLASQENAKRYKNWPRVFGQL